MSKEKRRVPKLRFPGFTEDWEQRKLESLFTKYEDKVNTPNSGYWRLGLRSHCKGTFHTYIDAGNELETAEMNRVKSGNFILNITFAWERALAVTNDEDQDKLVSHRFPQFKPNSDLVIDFFKHTLMDKRFKHHLELSSPGGAGRNKVLKVADMLKYELLVPSIKEQNEISSFLNHVDYIITLHQRKLEHLNLKKKALLQKLFPKNGERYPELRFPGFTDAWEQRKFGEIYERAGQKNDLTYGIDKIISVANMYFKKDVIVGSEEYLKTYNVFKLGDIAFEGHTNKEYRYGRFVENTIGDGIVSHIFDVFTPKINLDINFWKDLIKYEPIMGPILRRCTKASRMMSNLTTKEFLEEQILCPTLEEQKFIGEFIVSLDKNITLHQRKLEHLQLQKKALLQQMFV